MAKTVLRAVITSFRGKETSTHSCPKESKKCIKEACAFSYWTVLVMPSYHYNQTTLAQHGASICI